MNPKLIPQPFANQGNRNIIENNRQIGQSPEAATWADGFPAVTMTPIEAGGLPPFGLDFNGILYMITSHIVHAQKGGLYTFDTTFSTANNGYPKGAILQSSDGSKAFLNTIDNNTTDPDSTGAIGWEIAFGSNIVTVQNAPLSKLLRSEIIYDLSHDILKRWRTIGTWSGYASSELGCFVWGTTPSPRPYELDLSGQIVSKTTYHGLWAFAQANNHVTTSWTPKTFKFADVSSTVFRVPDMRDVFIRATGTDADNANARQLGSYQGDAIRNITGTFRSADVGGLEPSNSLFITREVESAVTLLRDNSGHTIHDTEQTFDASRVVPVSADNHPMNTSLAPRIIAF